MSDSEETGPTTLSVPVDWPVAPVSPRASPRSIAELVDLTAAARKLAGLAVSDTVPSLPPTAPPSATAIALAKARRKRAALLDDEEDFNSLELDKAAILLAAAAAAAARSDSPDRTASGAPLPPRKERRNASFIGSPLSRSPSLGSAGGLGSPPGSPLLGFEGGTRRGVRFLDRQRSPVIESVAEDEDERPLIRVSRVAKPEEEKFADAVVESVVESSRSSLLAQASNEEPSSSSSSRRPSSRRQPSVLDSFAAINAATSSQAHTHTAAAILSAASAAATAAATSAASSAPLPSSAHAELAAQVMEEWTSSDEDDIHISAEFKSSTILGRAERRAYGLRSMRQVMNLLARPLAPREYPLQEYEQHGAFQAVPYWPADGRFKSMKLTDARPTHNNLSIADPKAPMDSAATVIADIRATVAAAAPTPQRGTVAHSRHQSLQKTLHLSSSSARGGERPNNLHVTLPTNNDGASSSNNGTPVAGTPRHSPRLQPHVIDSLLATGSPGSLTADLNAAFSALDPVVMNRTEAEAEQAFVRHSARLKKSQAVTLYAAAQAAPFVKLRRDLESDSRDALTRFLASDRPLLTDAQIDALLAAKIDESVRRGFPRNRAELRGLSTKGAVSFGLPSAHAASANVERQVGDMVRAAGAGGNNITGMFHDDRELRAAHTRRVMVGMRRPYTARSTTQRREAAKVAEAWATTKRVNHEPPPVGTYNPSFEATSAARATPAVDLRAQTARDRPLTADGATRGLGAAETLRSTQKGNRARLAGSDPTPGPADTEVTRLFDTAPVTSTSGRASSSAQQRMRPTSAFGTSDIGRRTMVVTSGGIPKPLLAGSAALGSFSAIAHPPPRGHALGTNEFIQPTPFEPLNLPKPYTSIGEGPHVSFTSGTRDVSATDTGVAPSAAKASAANVPVQYAPTSAIGPRAHLPHAPRAPAVQFARAERAGMEILNMRQLKAQKDRRTADQRSVMRQRAADAEAKRVERQERKVARLERLAAEAARRDTEFFAATAERRVGANGARANVLALQARAAAAVQARENERLAAAEAAAAAILDRRSSLKRTSSIASAADSAVSASSTAATPRVNAGVAAGAGGSAAVPLDTSSSEESDGSLGPSARESRAIRERVGPMSSFTPAAKAARLEAQRALRKARQGRARVVRAGQERTREAALEKLEAREDRRNQTRDDAELARRIKDVQMIWLFLVAGMSRVNMLREKHDEVKTRVRDGGGEGRDTVRALHPVSMLIRFFASLLVLASPSQVILSLSHLPPGVAARVVDARNAWRRLVVRSRRERGAQVLQRFFRLALMRIRRRRSRAAVTIVTSFLREVSRRERAKTMIWKFKQTVVRIQRWWRRTAAVPRARREALERLWSRTLELRWEELIRYRLYLACIVSDAASLGAYVALSGQRISVAAEDRQRYANLVLVWRANEEDLNATSIVPPPFPTQKQLHANAVAAAANSNEKDTAAAATAATTSTSKSHDATEDSARTATSPPPPVENVWERFVWPLVQRTIGSPGGPVLIAPPVAPVAVAPTRPHSGHARRPSKVPPGATSAGTPRHRKQKSSATGLSVVVIQEAGTVSTPVVAAATSVTFKDDDAARATSLPPLAITLPSETNGGVSSRSQASQSQLPVSPRHAKLSLAVRQALASASGISSDRAELDFESYLGVIRPPAMKESKGGQENGSHHQHAPSTVISATAITSTSSAARRTALRNFYLRTRRLHRKLIYQVRTFGGRAGAAAASGGAASTSITGEDESGFYRLSTGLPLHLSSRWLHLLHVGGMQELLMECMVPRSLSIAHQSGFIARTRSELLRVFRDPTFAPRLVLRHHPGWPWFVMRHGERTAAPHGATICDTTQERGEREALGAAHADPPAAAPPTRPLSAAPPAGGRPASGYRRQRPAQGSVGGELPAPVASSPRARMPLHARNSSNAHTATTSRAKQSTAGRG